MEYHKHIAEVYKKIAPYIKKTPVLISSYFSQKVDGTLIFKCENLQYTNAFKLRGAFNKITTITDKNKTIVAASAGNHGLAVAFAAKKFDMNAIVIVPEFVPQFRINMIRELGAEVIVHGTTMDELNAKAAEYTKDPHFIYFHPFDDDDIIAGQATVAYELLQEIPDIDIIIVPVGGGGLISGISQYAKSFNPNILVYGVETIGADAMYKSLEAGRIIALPKITSIAISLGATKVAEKTFEIVKKNVTKIVTVTDEEAIRELKDILEKEKLFVEPASSCALSAVISGKIPHIKNKKIAVILSGGNFSLEQLKTYL
ncbi:MAG TPA: threonine/serine dehydratase [Gammaproteobacteria bacterium]|nr:threonine/serine dehydratase [Gammaproteobacteria bacterium]